MLPEISLYFEKSPAHHRRGSPPDDLSRFCLRSRAAILEDLVGPFSSGNEEKTYMFPKTKTNKLKIPLEVDESISSRGLGTLIKKAWNADLHRGDLQRKKHEL